MSKTPADRPTLFYKPYFWLIFSFYYFMPLFFLDLGALELTLFLVAYAGFVACYLSAFHRFFLTRVHWPLVGMVAIGVVTSPLTASVDTFFAYSGLLVGLSYPPRILIPATAALAGLCVGLALWHGYPFPFLSLTGSFAVVALACLGVAERLRLQMYDQDRRSREEIEHLATIAERERIARDLHDILGHSLSSIALKTELAKKLLDQNQVMTASRQLTELNQIARDSLQLVRQTVSGYKHQGLRREIENFCQRLTQKGFAVHLEGEVPHLNAKAETTLVLALTELITNVLRHSQGNECHLGFQQRREELVVRVSDDGRDANIELGNGLEGVKERLKDLNGRLTIATGHWSQFTMTFPWTQVKAA